MTKLALLFYILGFAFSVSGSVLTVASLTNLAIVIPSSGSIVYPNETQLSTYSSAEPQSPQIDGQTRLIMIGCVTVFAGIGLLATAFLLAYGHLPQE